MKRSTEVQKFYIPLTVTTVLGFAGACVIFAGYIIFLRQQTLRVRHSELQYLQEENRQLIEQKSELEQQLIEIQNTCGDLHASSGGAETIEAEIQKGAQRSFVYTVKPGDTIWDIASLYNVEVKALMRWNKLGPRSQIFPGDELLIILNEN